MSEITQDMAAAIGTSVVEQKTPHLVNAGAASTAVIVSAAAPEAAGLMDWLPAVAVFCSICVSMAYFIKAYLEIKLVRIEIAVKSRRKTDRTTEPLKPGPYVK